MAYGEVFTALADPTRRHILEALRKQPKTVGELAEGQPVSRPAVSQHLKVLQAARLVTVQPQGNRRLYSIKRDGLDDLRRYLEGFWSDVLTSYGAEIVRRISERNGQLVAARQIQRLSHGWRACQGDTRRREAGRPDRGDRADWHRA